MSRQRGEEESIVGLAKRWLKLQFRFHGDPHRAVGERREAERIENRLEHKVKEDIGTAVVSALMPPSWKRKLGELEHASEERRAEADRRRRAEHEARPRAAVRLAFGGDVVGPLEAEIPIAVGWPDEAGDTLTVELEPLEPIAVGGRAFRGLTFAVPGYRGPGRYDLSTLAAADFDNWDPFWFQLWLESEDEALFWSPDYGQAAIEVDADEQALRLTMPMEDAGGTRVELDASVALPVSQERPQRR